MRSRTPIYLARRLAKGQKILHILQEHLGDAQLRAIDCLDIGCSIGEIDALLLQQVHTLASIDLDFGSLAIAWENHPELNVFNASGEALPFADASWGLVVCAQVYEHVQHPQHLFDEIWRVLRPGGWCFFSGPNKYALIEEHYKLPFLSWLPYPWADSYVRAFQRGQHFEPRPLTYWQLRQGLKHFQITDWAPYLLTQPRQYGLALPALPLPLVRMLLAALNPWLPNYNWFLYKPETA